jgi:EmrB/QacA subfamily drug resistance transporter
MFTKAEKRTVLAASCLAIFVNPLAGTMLNLALSAIQVDFGCSEHQLGWVASIYFIVSVMFILPAAKIADIFGKKVVFLTGAVIAAAGVILSMSSPNIHALYFFRGVTGVGMAAISSTSVSMISDVYEPHERGLALAINTACVYVGSSIGPTLGGVITEFAGWRYIFLILVPFLVLAFICMFRFSHNIKSTPDGHFDIKGTVVYGTGVGVLMFGVISLPAVHGIAMIIAGTAVLIGFLFLETKESNPIMRLGLFKNMRFSRSMLALFLNYAASYGVTFFMSRYLQEIGALSPTEAGLIMMSQSVVQVIFTLWAGKIVTSMDMRILPTIGMLVTSAALIMMMFITETLNVSLIIVSLMVLGAGLGLFSSPNVTAIMSYVKKEEYNNTSGLIAAVRQFGMTMSMGIATCLISVFLGTETVLEPSNYGMFMDILMYAWCIWLAFCLIGALFSWFRGPSYSEG